MVARSIDRPTPKKIIALLTKHDFLTIPQISEKSGIQKKTCSDNIRYLMDLGLVHVAKRIPRPSPRGQLVAAYALGADRSLIEAERRKARARVKIVLVADDTALRQIIKRATEIVADTGPNCFAGMIAQMEVAV